MTSFGYDADGDQTSVTDALGHTATTSYDETGAVIASTDRRGSTTTYSHDANGNLISSLGRRGGRLGQRDHRSCPCRGQLKVTDSASDSSYGIYEATANFVANSSFETNTTGWSVAGSGVTIGQDGSAAKFGSDSLKVATPGANAHEGASYTTATGLNLAANSTIDVSGWVKGSSGANSNPVSRAPLQR